MSRLVIVIISSDGMYLRCFQLVRDDLLNQTDFTKTDEIIQSKIEAGDKYIRGLIEWRNLKSHGLQMPTLPYNYQAR